MGKNKRWHLGLILAVLGLTFYNVLPTVFYYCKPLSRSINCQDGKKIEQTIQSRIDHTHEAILDWVKAYCKQFGLKIAKISTDANQSGTLILSFHNEEDTEAFKNGFYQASSSIDSVSRQLRLIPHAEEKTIVISKKLGLNSSIESMASFKTYFDEEKVNKDYLLHQVQNLNSIIENLFTLEHPTALSLISQEGAIEEKFEILNPIADNITKFTQVLKDHPTAFKRILASFTQGDFENKAQLIQTTSSLLDQYKEKVRFEKVKLLDEEKKLIEESKELPIFKKEQLSFLKSKEETLFKAITAFKKNHQSLILGKKKPSKEVIDSIVSQLIPENKESIKKTSLQGFNPFFEALSYDWKLGKITLHPYSDLKSENDDVAFTELTQLVMNEASKLAHLTSSRIKPVLGNLVFDLHHLEQPRSELDIDCKLLAKQTLKEVEARIKTYFIPQSEQLKDFHQSLSFVSGFEAPKGNKTSLYVIVKNGMDLLKSIEAAEENPAIQMTIHDLRELQSLLYGMEFYPAKNSGFDQNSLVFEAKNFYAPFVEATKENFLLSANQEFLTVQFTDLKQRLYTVNKIETEEHQNLVKSKNDYFASINHPQSAMRPVVVQPTKSTLISNFLLSSKKYFRGDERKILRWGLDLSGGKSVEVALFNHENQKVTEEKDLKLAINELYSRVNKLGVSEVLIRSEGEIITLDFPGSQELSAKDLLQSSSMTFHVVNEKFNYSNIHLREPVDRFLQEVWNQALLTNRFDADHLNAIASDLLYGDGKNHQDAQPRSDAAKSLYENGFRLEKLTTSDRTIDDQTCKIVPYRVESKKGAQTMQHPLMIVFAEPALEGAHLANIQSGYDPKEGNFLNFEVKKSATSYGKEGIYPQEILSNWTNKFSKDVIKGTNYEVFSHGHGYRMAVVLNGEVVTSPSLNAAIKEGGRITGSFTQAEVYKLENDLKAGSLTFTPKILSEKNISPELGDQERFLGILATVVALTLVVLTMTFYYRFAGVVASIAVLFNLLIMWAILQNIQATLTLAGLAGVVLTVGMAVDANVLVFERIKEELKIHKELKIALETGYEKAFSAIVDSNLTTILAGLVLLNFDSGPVKGFAVTLIIGVASSMFTALFMTRYFFRSLIEKNRLKELKMMNWIKSENIQFIKYAKPAFIATTCLIATGVYFGAMQKETLFGMDFTGGYATNITCESTSTSDAKSSINQALEKIGLSKKDYSIRELGGKYSYRLFLSKNLDSKLDALFHGKDGSQKAFQIHALLKDRGVNLSEKSLLEMEKSWTQVSSQMSETMRNQALIGIGIALLGILVYITFRFEMKFALASTLGLGVVISVTMALVSILNKLGVPLQIDLNMVAAVLTIVGYSLNDTIIVFDRIREDMKKNPHLSIKELANQSLNTTLSRTLLTSGTTLVVLLALVALGGSSIFSFSFVMALGVLIGTLSTFYCATPLLLYFEKKDKKEKKIFSKLA